jgi:pimeloyl-ACP methyl ester carboxylesterase
MSLARGQADGTAFLRRPGSGPALVLLHGIGSRAESWQAMVAALPAALPVIAWDAPGYGASRPLAAFAPTPTDYALRLAALLDALGQDRVVLVGHSLGALFAAAFAARHPARVLALACLSPALGYAVPPGAALPQAVQARIDELQRLGPADFAEARAARLLARPLDAPEVLAAVRAAMAAVLPLGYAQAVRALGAGDLLADAARIAAPTLVAVGAEDVVTPPANAERLHAALPHPADALRVIAACGHALPQEAPGAAAALLGGLLAEAGCVG